MSESHPNKDVRMRGFQSRVDLSEAQQLLWNELAELPFEEIVTARGHGRVLATDLIAPENVPGFRRSAMDGYALKGEETFGATDYSPLRFRLIGESFPGRPFSEDIEAGQCVRIMTGAAVPGGADSVVMAEHAISEGEQVGITASVPPGKNVGQIGEDIKRGERILVKGRRLRPQDVAAAVSVGLTKVEVIRRPVVRLVITGDELLAPGSIPTGGQIVDSNSVMLQGLVARDGGIVEATGVVRDRKPLVTEAIVSGSPDVVLVSGGSSVGVEDHAPIIVSEHGRLMVHGIAVRPASPAGFGRIDNRLVFLLPGNPVSCLCAYDLLAGPAIRSLGGLSRELPYRTIQLGLLDKIASAIGRADYVRVSCRKAGVLPLAISGASILSSTTRADGFVMVPQESEGFAQGDLVTVNLYD